MVSKMASNFKFVTKMLLKFITLSFPLLSLYSSCHQHNMEDGTVHKTMLVQKLHDATLASLSILEKS